MTLFQPTLPLRGATLSPGLNPSDEDSFNPRSPCGERREPFSVVMPPCLFQPTLLAGSDSCTSFFADAAASFNPRSPCGERHALVGGTVAVDTFQPTLPLRGATAPCPIRDGRRPSFNPRSPCGERRSSSSIFSPRSRFNPRSPCGERPRPTSLARTLTGFNPRSPCGERLEGREDPRPRPAVSTHAPLAGSD